MLNMSIRGIANASGIDLGQMSFFRDQTRMYIPLAYHCANGTYLENLYHMVMPSKTMFVITNFTYKGLTTYQAIKATNAAVKTVMMEVGQLLNIHVRSAYPLIAQQEGGLWLLLSYAIFPRETLSLVSSWLNIFVMDIEAANTVMDSSTLLAFSTLFIPLLALVPLNSSTLALALALAPPTSDTSCAKDPSNTPFYIGMVTVGVAGLTLASILA